MDDETTANAIRADSSFTSLVLDEGLIDRVVGAVSGEADNIQDIFPLVPLQEENLVQDREREKDGDHCVGSVLLRVSSRDLLEALIAAFGAAVDRHDVLRMAVLWEELPRPVQIVYRRVAMPVEHIQLESGSYERAARLREWMQPQRQRIDIRQAPLIRLQVGQDARGKHWFVLLSMHPLMSDASRELMLSDVAGNLSGHAQEFLPSAPYRTYVMQAMAYARTQDGEAFFRSKLADIDESTAPFGFLSVQPGSGGNDATETLLETTLSQSVRAQARRFGVSMAALFHAAASLVVAHTSGREDVVFGTTVGPFANTLPLRLQLQETTAKDLIERVQRELVELLSHENASLAMAQRCSNVGKAPLFTALLNYRHGVPNRWAKLLSAAGIEVLAVHGATNYPISLSIDDDGEGFKISAQTDRRIDSQRMATYLRTALYSLVEALERASKTPVLQLSVLTAAERWQVVEGFNATDAPYPQDKLIHQLFEAQVTRAPGAMAATYHDRSLTYAELNAKANRLARHLRAQDVCVGEHIPVFMRRSPNMLIAQLAILKSGCVYVPLDPELPAERLAFVIRDCDCRFLLADDDLPPEIPTLGARVIKYQMSGETLASYSAENLNLMTADAVPPAYVMYTSGSTGTPKGVVVPHHAVSRLVINNGYAHITSADRIAHHSNPTFDASTFEIWGALLHGASIVVIPQSVVLEAGQFAEVLRSRQVTVLYMSVGLFRAYSESLGPVFSRLRYLIVGGEALDPKVARTVLERNPPQHLLNAYGPTECTTFASTHLVIRVDADATSIPIGRPISNTRIYILDSRLQVVPTGAAGEIYIGGAGVAQGYLNRPELTSIRFVHDPFTADPQARMYKTGDLGRWRADGAIEYLGRNDFQVKIRGFRIELGEIEAHLARHGRVREAVVLAREDLPGDKRLVAYVVTADRMTAVIKDELRAYLKSVLPEYMVPGAFVVLPRLPLTSNGKVDRKALPIPELDAYASRPYEEPLGSVEEILAEIWQNLLHVERVGRQDNVFELGGNSLLATQLMVAIAERFAISFQARLIFSSPTLWQMARLIERLQGKADDERGSMNDGVEELLI